MNSQLELRLGAMADPILDQLATQGMTLDDSMKGRVQKDADAITRLVLGELISDSVARNARDRLFRRIKKSIREVV